MVSSLSATNRPEYDFAAPIDLGILSPENEIVATLAHTRAFERLRSVRFLGGIDYLLVRSPNGARGNVRYNRYQHSLGVARLAMAYCVLTDVPHANKQLICASALLHDIGHAPLSHSLEPVFKEYFDLDHHRATEQIIRGEIPIGNDIPAVLSSFGVDADQVVSVLSGQSDPTDGFFAGPINFDTIEGILRAHSYKRTKQNLLTPEAVVTAATRRQTKDDRAGVDEFWRRKNQIYRDVINSPSGVMADFVCQIHMRNSIGSMAPEDFFSTEPELFRKMPDLRDTLVSRSFDLLAKRLLDKPLRYVVREFSINECGDFFSRQDKERYQQTRTPRVLEPIDGPSGIPRELNQDLFNDDGP